MKLGLISQPRI